MKNIVAAVEDYCAASGISIAEFERKCELGHGVVYQWKVRGNNPRIDTLVRIAEKTGKSINWWLKAAV